MRYVVGKPKHLEPTVSGRVGVLDYSSIFINVLDGTVDFRSYVWRDSRNHAHTQYIVTLANGRDVRLPSRMIRRIGYIEAGPDGEPRFIDVGEVRGR